jgi:hypothetical protein
MEAILNPHLVAATNPVPHRKYNQNIHPKNVTKVLLVLKSIRKFIFSDESQFSLYGFIPSEHIIFTASVGVHPYRMGVRRCSFPRPFFISRRYSFTTQTATR